MSDWDKAKNEYPKAAMIVEWLARYYPDNSEQISNNKLVMAAIVSPNYTPEQVYDIIDKIALFNGWVKWGPLT